jgi:outer membrane PBP1 activator LpoA protein
VKVTYSVELLEATINKQVKRIAALEDELQGRDDAKELLLDRIEALEAALQRITKWVRQNPEANAGDRAGDELLDIVRSIAALAPEQDK